MKKVITILVCVLVMLMSGCGSQRSTATNGEVTVVTSFYPMYVATLNITNGVEGVKVVNMTKPQTGCLHDYQLSTQDMALLETADVMVVNGGGMESFLDKVIKKQPKLKIVEASKGIAMLKDGDAENPHVWVSIANEIKQAKNIAAQLSEIDSAHKDQYEKNCSVYVEKLEALQKKMHGELDEFSGREIITFHEAFPYFADEFGLKIAAVIDREPGTEPTPKELEETIEIIKAANIKAIFTEPQYSIGAAETISKATGAKVYELDPVVTGEADIAAMDAYIITMEKNMQVLKNALK